MAEEVDLFVIGAGSGGVRAARIAAGYGARVMIAEEYRVGGTCVIRGCVPKKLLVYASRFADEFEDAAGFGWTVPRADVRLGDADRQQGQGDRPARERPTPPISNAPSVDDRQEPRRASTIRTPSSSRRPARRCAPKHILIATGGWPSLGKDIPGNEHVISSNEAFHLKELPKRILIQGGGYIAVEFAGIFNGLGSEVTLVYRGDNILRGFDDDVRTHLRAEMEKRGIKVLTKDIVEAIEKVEWRALRRAVRPRGRSSVDKVMFATGRRPNVNGLGLEAAGVKLDETGAIAVERIFADQRAAHLRGRRRHRPRQPHAGGDPRGPRLRRHRVRRQADAGRSHQCADRGVLRARGRRRSG